MTRLLDRFSRVLADDGPVANSPWSRIALGLVVVAAVSVALVVRVHPVELHTIWTIAHIPEFIADIALFVLAVAGAAVLIKLYDAPVWSSFRMLLLISCLLVGMVWITRALTWWYPEIGVFAFPVPLAALLATVMISERYGLLLSMLSVITGALLGISAGAEIVGTMVWALFGIAAAKFMPSRRALSKPALILIGAGFCVGIASGLSQGAAWSLAMFQGANGVMGGALAVVIGFGLLPFLEKGFRITTDVSLQELCDPSHPLLRDLSIEAPGSYSHSMMAGNLAEAAAHLTGARPLLARAGAYYHDIGKLRRPDYFAENQEPGANPHDSRVPTLSASIITAHVREGVELAKSYRLPREIVDIIQQHHGTSIVTHFYNKAAESHAPVHEADFRYDGDVPTTREAALVMLADCAEAVAKTIRRPNGSRIESSVRKVVEAKVADGQLTESGLTLGDVETVIKVYSRMLSGVYHSRVEYYLPRSVRAMNADSNHQP